MLVKTAKLLNSAVLLFKMPKSKSKIIAVFGGISAVLGSAGAAISSFGLCACVWAPLLSVAGITSIVMGFLSKNSMYFFAVGAALLIGSYILHQKSKVCPVHKKK